MVKENDNIICEVNKVKICFTDKEITAYGGYSLLSKFFDKIKLREYIERILPIKEESPNSPRIYSKIIGNILILFSGGNRFSHMLYLGSKNVLAKLFGVKRLPEAATTLTRMFNKVLTKHIKKISLEFLTKKYIKFGFQLQFLGLIIHCLTNSIIKPQSLHY
ncbi:transposase family protein [Candidatus Omnitrophus magneticus]|uniref:Transposase family protein n=1 Tax=Candidatus Omnitrophus magneticus TaxID=1609969 RepID=A0A0F0CUE4_9BACT|nr:transposase family protein [Candidatus Omnitrophus magneticus]